MHKSATKCNETIGKWCKNKHGASKIIDTFETYQQLKSRSATKGTRVEESHVKDSALFLFLVSVLLVGLYALLYGIKF
jgi:hypothetical protein